MTSAANKAAGTAATLSQHDPSYEFSEAVMVEPQPQYFDSLVRFLRLIPVATTFEGFDRLLALAHSPHH